MNIKKSKRMHTILKFQLVNFTHVNTVDARYNAVVRRQVSYPRYNLTTIYRKDVKEMIQNDVNTYPFCETYLTL